MSIFDLGNFSDSNEGKVCNLERDRNRESIEENVLAECIRDELRDE